MLIKLNVHIGSNLEDRTQHFLEGCLGFKVPVLSILEYSSVDVYCSLGAL